MNGVNAVVFKSDSAERETPQELFDKLDSVYHFNLDPCSTHENAKCERHFTKVEDGLKQPWGGYTVWCNPPYGKEIIQWVKKGYTEGHKPGTTVVMLLPARTDTKWFHEYCTDAKITFIRGRIKFGGSKNNAPFPSILVEFKSGETDETQGQG